ncbi:hypothetical protein GIB67_038053 [Kingdonia uniflora]|uniref:Uncharacterized protein n=1 Tax=Kingdonia uniflora TaxID=39325 RepID=A0A7J7LIT4_9MAGN|nr:hypothetical protein GIB67_038053 [Kingdonia uniflora]
MVLLEKVLTQSFKLGFIFWIQFFDKIKELAGLFEERDYHVTMQILPFPFVFLSRSDHRCRDEGYRWIMGNVSVC